jgi:hypothetical protein
MAPKTKSDETVTEDLVEKSIADAKKVRQIALKSAEKTLKERYSQDLKKIYLNKLTEEFDVDLDLEPDVDHLNEEYGMLGEDEDPQDDPFAPGNEPGSEGDDPFMGMPDGEGPEGVGGPGGAGGAGGAAPMGPDVDPMSAGGGGEAPDANTMSGVSDQVPYDHEPKDPAAILAQIKQLVADGAETDPVELSLDFDQQSQDDMNMTPEMGGGEMPELEESLDYNMFKPESLKINDNVLLDYIERSLRNDGKVKQLQDDIEIVSLQINQLQEALSRSNANLKELSKQNARLVYQNKVLIDDSLSEHQKHHIVKALDKAETLKEAKAIFETAKVTKPKSATNAVNKALGTKATGTTNLIRESQRPPEMIEGASRWQELAGIKRK